MGREEMLAAVEAAYAARRSSDFSALGAILAEDAVFETAGDKALMAAVPGSGGAAWRISRGTQILDTAKMVAVMQAV